METLICEDCAAPIPFSGVDRRLQLATCGHCGGIFDISSDVRSGLLFREPPAGLQVDKQHNLWRASWRNVGEAFTLVIAAIGVIIAALTMMPVLEHALFLVIFALFLLVLAHYEISATSIELTRSRLVVESSIGFWRRCCQQELNASDIEQVFVAEKEPSRFELHIVTTDNRHQHITAEAIGGDLTMPVAFYLEQEIENFLELRDRPVSGESGVKQALLRA